MTDFHQNGRSISFLSQSDESPEIQDNLERFYSTTNEGKKKKFICSFPGCQKIFRFKSEIERHVSAHSESRPYTCTFEECRKSFKRADALEDHVRSQHTGEAPLICAHPGCGLHFTTNAKLRYHVALHKGAKPYKCSIRGCERAFITLSQLKQHERSVLAHKRLSLTENHDENQINYLSGSPREKTRETREKRSKAKKKPLKKVKIEAERVKNCENQLFKAYTNHQETLKEVVKVEHQFPQDQNSLKELNIITKEDSTSNQKLEECERFFNNVKTQKEEICSLISEKFQHLVLPQNSLSAFWREFETQKLPSEPYTKDVDSFFFENENTTIELFSDYRPTRAESFDTKFLDRKDGLLLSLNLESFPSPNLK